MRKQVKVVVVSKDENFLMTPEDFNVNEDLEVDVAVTFVKNNCLSLATLYNRELANAKDLNFDMVALMHSDVKLNVTTFIKHLLEVSSKYDLIGLCGTSVMNIGHSPLNWFTGSRSTPTNRWGCVTHQEIGNVCSFFSGHSPDVSDHEVSCIDGLCIVFGKKALECGLQFDETLGKYDFYDTDISMQAFLRYHLRIGVIVQRDLIHTSVGRSIMSNKFLEEELKFRQKWNFPMTPELDKYVQLLSENKS